MVTGVSSRHPESVNSVSSRHPESVNSVSSRHGPLVAMAISRNPSPILIFEVDPNIRIRVPKVGSFANFDSAGSRVTGLLTKLPKLVHRFSF